jgi:hypothetical protein
MNKIILLNQGNYYHIHVTFIITELEEELLRELRRFGDQIDGTLMARVRRFHDYLVHMLKM